MITTIATNAGDPRRLADIPSDPREYPRIHSARRDYIRRRPAYVAAPANAANRSVVNFTAMPAGQPQRRIAPQDIRHLLT